MTKLTTYPSKISTILPSISVFSLTQHLKLLHQLQISLLFFYYFMMRTNKFRSGRGRDKFSVLQSTCAAFVLPRRAREDNSKPKICCVKILGLDCGEVQTKTHLGWPEKESLGLMRFILSQFGARVCLSGLNLECAKKNLIKWR